MAIEDPKYGNLVKSVSAFTIKEKHQDTDKGEIYEQDITTIGEHVYVGDDKKPVFRSGNFIITSSNERTTPMPPVDASWETSPSGDGEFWTWDDVRDITEEEDPSISLELKPDVYDLRTFAYYGSCVELIRGSLNHIITTFPGELYASDQKLTYLKDKGTANEAYAELGQGAFVNVVDNPFGLDIHSQYVDPYFINKDPLKYILANDFYKENYKFYVEGSTEGKDINSIIYSTASYNCDSDGDGKNDNFSPYSQMGTITVSYNGGSVTIQVWKLKGKDYVYLTNTVGWHIRPISKHYNSFRNNLSIFEKTLLSEDTLPKYSPNFEILSEAEYGFDAQMQQFTFPLGLGKYNLGITTLGYTSYVGKLSKIAEFYDEYFCDNLYKVMTHEAIQNFDWSFSREKDSKAESEYTEGGTKFQKILRVIAREFDEIKLYIEGIGQANKVTYNGNGNVPDYLLTDLVENMGWAYKHIIPFIKDTIKDENNKEITSKNGGSITFYPEIDSDTILQPYNYTPDTDGEGCSKKPAIEKVKTHTNEAEYTPNDINNLFSRILILNSKPIWRKKGTIDAIDSLLSLFGLKNKKWIDDYNKTRQKFRNGEGFICPVDCPDREMYSDITHGGNTDNLWDYEIKEYTYRNIKMNLSAAEREKWGITINSKKNIGYSEDANINSRTITPWRGLLVTEKEYSDGSYTIFPWYNKDKENDGKPYYQMYGGWLRTDTKLYKKTEFDNNDRPYYVDDILKSNCGGTGKPYFTETINKVRGVANIKEMLNTPLYDLNSGDFCYVVDLSRYYVILDGIAYDMYPYMIKDKVIENWYYINATVRNGIVVLGEQAYLESIHIYEPNKTTYEKENKVKALDDYRNNTNVRIFAYKNPNTKAWEFALEDGYGNKARNVVIVEPESFGYTISEDNFNCGIDPCVPDETPINFDLVPTHYFKLHNKTFASYISTLNGVNRNNTMGWYQLSEDSEDYKYVKSIENDFEGNNPHTHKIESDGGLEYLRYFAQLFKYTIENQLFNYDSLIETFVASGNSTEDFLNEIYDFGFKGLFSDEEFCEPLPPNEDVKIYKSKRAEDDDYHPHTEDETDLGESDAIINTKLVEITFNKCDGCNMNPKLKYINDVVVPYLSQLLPSTLIVRISYNNSNATN